MVAGASVIYGIDAVLLPASPAESLLRFTPYSEQKVPPTPRPTSSRLRGVVAIAALLCGCVETISNATRSAIMLPSCARALQAAEVLSGAEKKQ